MSMKKLAGQTAVYGVSAVLYKFLNYLLVPYFTRVMTTGQYGVMGDLYSLIPLAMVILTMGLESGYFRFAGKAANEAEKRNIFATTWGFTSLLAVVFMVFVAIFNRPIAVVAKYPDFPSYIWLVGLIIMFDVMSAVPFARLREQGRPGRFLMIRTLSVIVNIVLCLFFYSALPRLAAVSEFFAGWYDPAYGAGYAFIANLITSVVTLVMLVFSCGRVAPRIDRGLLRRVMAYSLPLLVAGIAGTANEYIDRQAIKFLMPEDMWQSALGVFNAVTKLGAVMILFTQVYRYGAEPYFLSSFKKEDFVQRNAEAMKFFVLVAVFIFLMITLFADLIGLMLGRDFRVGMHLLPMILVSNMLSGVILNLSFWYKQAEKTKYAIIITGIGLLFTVVFNILLVPTLGITGAVVARLVCEVVMVAVSYGLNRKHYPTPYDLRRMGEYVLVGAAVYGLSLLTAQLPAVAMYGCNAVLLGAFGVYAVRREKLDVAGMARSLLKRRK